MPISLPTKPVARTLCASLLIFGLWWGSGAQAGITYQLDSVHATSGDTVHIKGMLFNDTANALSWVPPKTLVLQWRAGNGQAVRSLAYLDTSPEPVNLPVNNFVAFSWRAVVPKTLKGLQAINIEGERTLLALDTSPLETSRVAGTPAKGPVIDAGAGAPGQADPPLPDRVVVAAGASVDQGPPPASGTQAAPSSAFDTFRTAISPFEPIYFDVGTKGGTNARFQISFKYRLSTPRDARKPGFLDYLYVGYTQTALWDLEGKSKPFIDTTYNPSLFWHNDKLWQSPDNNWYAGLSTGVEHKSNGKGGADSRSLNDGFIQPELNYRFGNGSTLSFTPRIKGYFSKNENPDYADYAGYVDWKLRWEQDNGLVLAGLYQQGRQGHSATQLEAAWPLQHTFLHMNGYLHLQYFRGYGETLLGYNQKSGPQVRLGLSFVP
jgi:outer membrane phospholipase A